MNELDGASVSRSCCHQKLVTRELPICFFERPPDSKDVTIIKIDTEGCEVEILEEIKDREEVPVYYIGYHSDLDRRYIDQLLPEHQLVRANVESKHRGNMCYLHKSISTTEDDYEIT